MVVGHDGDGGEARRQALDAGWLAWQGSECWRQRQAALHPTHPWCRGEITGGKKHKHFHSKQQQKTQQQRHPWLFLCLRSHFSCSSCCFNVPFHPHYSLLNVPLLANARNYFLLIFKLHWCWLHLPSLFTSTFNLPGGWVWLQGTILTSLSDNQTKLALKLLSCDCLKFLDTHWIWQMLLQRNYNVI